MRWRDNFRIAVGGIVSNKLRSALTVLGVLIGVAAVVILVAVGTGSSKAVADQINRLGTNTLTVFSSDLLKDEPDEDDDDEEEKLIESYTPRFAYRR